MWLFALQLEELSTKRKILLCIILLTGLVLIVAMKPRRDYMISPYSPVDGCWVPIQLCTPRPTDTPTPTSTSTPTPTHTLTPTSTNTPTSTSTPTNTPTPTSTFTPIPTLEYLRFVPLIYKQLTEAEIILDFEVFRVTHVWGEGTDEYTKTWTLEEKKKSWPE